MRILKSFWFAAGVLLAGVTLRPPAVSAAEIVLNPSEDTSLMEIAPDRNNGGEGWFLAGTTQNGPRMRGLLRFDFSSLPPGAVITSVDLVLEVTKVPDCGFGTAPFSLHRMLVSWGEGEKFAIDNQGGQGDPATVGEATWNHRFFGGAEWAAPGGLADIDFVDASSAQSYIYGIGDSPYHFTGPGMAADVQDWLANPHENFGWMFLCDEESTRFTARRFGASEDPNAAPTLIVQFEVVPEPGVFALGAAGLAAAGFLRLLRRPRHR